MRIFTVQSTIGQIVLIENTMSLALYNNYNLDGPESERILQKGQVKEWENADH